MLIDEGDVCALCRHDDCAPGALPCAGCTDTTMKFEWKPFPVFLNKEDESDG